MIIPTFWLFRTLRGSRRWLPCKPTLRSNVSPRKNALSLALSFPDGGTYGRQADQPSRFATTQSAEEPTFWTVSV